MNTIMITGVRRPQNRELAVAALIIVTLCGCQQTSSHSPTSSVSVADSPQATLEKTVQDFVAALTSSNLSKVETLLVPSVRAQMPTAKLKVLVNTDWHPFVGSGPIQSEPYQLISHGKKALLRIQFIGANGKQYRTNFILVNEQRQWHIQTIYPPATYTKPMTQGGGKSSA